MENSPLVSIIVPTYNRGPILKETLDAILSQTYRNYELIVVDDGSTDETRTLVESYSEQTPIKYIYQENKGVAAARNTGVQNSQGLYIAFCDSDDLWVPEKLEKQIPLFSESTALVYSDGYIFTELSNPKARFYEMIVPHRGQVYAELLINNFIATSSVIIRKAFIQRPFMGKTSEDWQMWLSVAKLGLFDYVDEPLIYYYEHSQGLSKAKVVLFESRIKVREKELAILRSDVTLNLQLIRRISRLILKDKILIKILSLLPERTMGRINSLYYGSKSFRRLIKPVIGS